MSEEETAGASGEAPVAEGTAAGGNDAKNAERPVGDGSSQPPPASISSGSDLMRFWLKVGGWMVMALGALTILLALHMRARFDGMPFLLMVGMIFLGISYVLAGQSLGQGYQWPLPLAAMACVFSPSPWLTMSAAIGFYLMMKDQLTSSALRKDVTSRANLAYGLWVAGVALMIYSWIITLGSGSLSWPVLGYRLF